MIPILSPYPIPIVMFNFMLAIQKIHINLPLFVLLYITSHNALTQPHPLRVANLATERKSALKFKCNRRPSFTHPSGAQNYQPRRAQSHTKPQMIHHHRHPSFVVEIRVAHLAPTTLASPTTTRWKYSTSRSWTWICNI